MKMNGINQNSLFNNIGLFSNQTTNKDEAAFIGNLAGVNRKVQGRNAPLEAIYPWGGPI